jgi:hypothetical protein
VLEDVLILSMSINPPTPPHTLDQRAITKDLFKKHSKLVANETWYLISYKWYKLWKEHVGFDSEDDKTTTSSQTQVEPIDNSDLVNAGASELPRLKLGLLEDSDYALVPEQVWNMLHTWYAFHYITPCFVHIFVHVLCCGVQVLCWTILGFMYIYCIVIAHEMRGTQFIIIVLRDRYSLTLTERYGGGPAIPRVVILDGHNKVARVEVYQLHIKLLNTKKDGSLNITSEIEVEISKTATVQELKNIHNQIA